MYEKTIRQHYYAANKAIYTKFSSISFCYLSYKDAKKSNKIEF